MARNKALVVLIPETRVYHSVPALMRVARNFCENFIKQWFFMLGIYFQDFHTFCSNAIERLQIKRNNMQSYKTC